MLLLLLARDAEKSKSVSRAPKKIQKIRSSFDSPEFQKFTDSSDSLFLHSKDTVPVLNPEAIDPPRTKREWKAFRVAKAVGLAL